MADAAARKVEDPFDLIHEGNEFASSSSHWSAADAYSRASASLQYRADTLSTSPSNEMEQQRIVSLYRTQSLEYFYKARHSLLQAMTFENERDRENSMQVALAGRGKMDPMSSFIGNEESKRRGTIFQRLFMMKVKADFDRGINQNEHNVQCNNNDFDIPAAPSSLLPTISTPSIEATHTLVDSNNTHIRLNEIENGLQRLGVSLPDHKSASTLINTSSEDQVESIIQQATDEVHFEGKSTVPSEGELQNNESDIDENDSMFEGYQDQLDDEDNLDVLLMKVEKLVATAGCENDELGTSNADSNILFVAIKNAQAFLLEARLCLEMGRVDANDDDLDEDMFAPDCDNSPSNADSSSKRRNQARDRIESAVRCLQGAIDI